MLAKEQRFIDRFAAHAAKAAQVQSRVKALEKIEKIELPKKRRVVKFDFRAAAALGRPGRDARRRHQALRPARRPRRLRPDDPPRRALVRDGQQRRRQVDAAEDDRRRARAGRRRGQARRQPEDGLLRAAVARAPRPGPDRRGADAEGLPARVDRRAAQPARRVPVFRRRHRQEDPLALGRREDAAGAGAHAARTRRTSSCSTSRPTISISRRRRCSSTRCTTSRAR